MKSRAFTLIELMVVVAIIAFLAGIAVPRYLSYSRKAKSAEAAMLLASLHTAEQMYWAEHGTYSTNLNGPDGLGWQPEGYNGGGKKANFYYTYGFYFPGAKEGVHYFTGKMETPPTTLEGTRADKGTFVAKATAEFGENDIDVWSIDDSRTISHLTK